MKPSPKKIFLHGWATDRRVWKEELRIFKGSLAVNLPGHGNKRQWNVPTLYPALECLMDSVKGEGDIIGIGWSLGAEVLIAAAKKIRMRALVLVGATPSFVEREGFAWGKKKTLVKRMLMDMRKSPEETLKRFYALNFTGDELKKKRAKDFLKLYEKPMGGLDLEGIITALSSLMTTDLRRELREVNLPTLIIHGAKDEVVPVGAAEYLKENIKGAQIKIFKEAGHAPFVSEKEEFDRTVERFIAGI
ncbi:MAG: alpha/beta fold hydrolase [Deltaproteobacteria bacterium]|nr:alpha/beta fold hydrolase [Deltaproteobacteria bacterium]